MIQLDEIINRIYFELKEKIPVEKIERLITESGIAETLETRNMNLPKAKLSVRAVRFSGQKWEAGAQEVKPFLYERTLYQGVNAWISGNSTGKSTILKIILWAITGEKPNFKPDIYTWIERVLVEIELSGNGIYTIEYTPDKLAKVIGAIYEGSIPDVINGGISPIDSFSGFSAMKKTIGSFFEKRIGFFALEWYDRSRDNVNINKKVVSWETYSQALYLNSENINDYLFSDDQLNGNHHQKAISMYLELNAIEAIALAQMKYDEATNQFAFEKRRIETNSKGVRQKINDLQKELADIERKISSIDTNDTVLIDPQYAIKVRESVAECNDRYTNLTQELNDLENEQRQSRINYDDARRSLHGLTEAISFNRILSGIKVTKCPNCENLLEPISIEDEIESGHCRVCHNELKNNNHEDLAELIKKIKKSTSELHKDLNRITNTINKKREVIDETLDELRILESEYKDLSRQERAGISVELKRLIDQRGYINGQLDYLNQITLESQLEHLGEISDQRKVYQATFKILKDKVLGDNKKILNQLSEMTTNLAKDFGVQNLERIEVNNKFELIIKQSANSIWFPKMEVGERLRIKFAFHLALLSLRIHDNVGRHPCLLIVDAPGSAEMTNDILVEIMRKFSEIENDLDNNAQILIASAREELLDIFDITKVQHKPFSEKLF